MIFGSCILRASWSLALFFAFAPASALHATELKPKVTVAAFGLYGDQSVFESEAKGAARIVADRFGGNPVIVHANTKSREDANFDIISTRFQSTSKAIYHQHSSQFLTL